MPGIFLANTTQILAPTMPTLCLILITAWSTLSQHKSGPHTPPSLGARGKRVWWLWAKSLVHSPCHGRKERHMYRPRPSSSSWSSRIERSADGIRDFKINSIVFCFSFMGGFRYFIHSWSTYVNHPNFDCISSPHTYTKQDSLLTSDIDIVTHDYGCMRVNNS